MKGVRNENNMFNVNTLQTSEGETPLVTVVPNLKNFPY